MFCSVFLTLRRFHNMRPNFSLVSKPTTCKSLSLQNITAQPNIGPSILISPRYYFPRLRTGPDHHWHHICFDVLLPRFIYALQWKRERDLMWLSIVKIDGWIVHYTRLHYRGFDFRAPSLENKFTFYQLVRRD